jgi:hypothetical protein
VQHQGGAYPGFERNIGNRNAIGSIGGKKTLCCIQDLCSRLLWTATPAPWRRFERGVLG